MRMNSRVNDAAIDTKNWEARREKLRISAGVIKWANLVQFTSWKGVVVQWKNVSEWKTSDPGSIPIVYALGELGFFRIRNSKKIKDHLEHYLLKNGFISNDQFGFLKQASTGLQLLENAKLPISVS